MLTASINLQGVSGGCQNALAFTAREKAVGHIAPEVSNIVLFDFCTQQMHQVTVNGASWRPVWSPDGSTIAYVSTADSHGYSQIYVQPADAGESEAINVSAGLLYARFPAWSPDGQHLSFSGVARSSEDPHIYVVDKTGLNLRALVTDHFPGLVYATYSGWSPDGKRIALIVYHGEGEHSIAVVDADGTGFIEIPVKDYLQNFLSWNPDVESIAFNGFHMYLLHLGNMEVEQLTSDGDTRTPTWSPDGNRLAYASFTDQRFQIFVLDMSDHRRRTQVTFESDGHSPVWSSDGTSLAFVSARDGHGNIYTMDATGENVRRITDNAQSYEDPAWFSPNMGF